MVGIGKEVRLYRRALKIGQVELAKSVGCSVSQLRNIESGRSLPSLGILEKIANALDVRLVVTFTCV